MGITATQCIQLIQRSKCLRIGCGADTQRNQYLIGMQPRIMVVEMIDFQLADRLQCLGAPQHPSEAMSFR